MENFIINISWLIYTHERVYIFIVLYEGNERSIKFVVTFKPIDEKKEQSMVGAMRCDDAVASSLDSLERLELKDRYWLNVITRFA